MAFGQGANVRVLIVDDSAFVRTTVAKKLALDPEIEIVGSAKNGREALEQVQRLRPDVVTMDVEMPHMDGLAALERIMTDAPTPVIMLSSLTGEGTTETLRALELGAVDFFCKPSNVSPAGYDAAATELRQLVKGAAKVRPSRLKPLTFVAPPPRAAKPASRGMMRHVIVIASSTGGPRALLEMIPRIPADIPAGIVIVQHMPAGFTRGMADRLSKLTALDVREAQQGDRLSAGVCLVAPGGFHMTVSGNGTVGINEDPPMHGVRPAADVAMSSVARAYGSKSLGVVLTGMGSDGALGAGAIKAAGGAVAAEAEQSCVVFGMPRAAIEAGHVDHVVPLRRMAHTVAQMCGVAEPAATGGAR